MLVSVSLSPWYQTSKGWGLADWLSHCHERVCQIIMLLCYAVLANVLERMERGEGKDIMIVVVVIGRGGGGRLFKVL